MGAVFSDNFLLSPYYYSVVCREASPRGGFTSIENSPQFQIGKAMTLVKYLVNIRADAAMLTKWYKIWEGDPRLNLACFRQKKIENLFSEKLNISQFWAAWLVCVLASPVLEAQTKLWLIFNAVVRRTKMLEKLLAGSREKLQGGAGAGNDKKKKRKNKKDSNDGRKVSDDDEDKMSNRSGGAGDEENNALAIIYEPKDTRKQVVTREQLIELLGEIFQAMSLVLDADGCVLSDAQVASLLDRSQFTSWPTNIETSVTILKDDITYSSICRMFLSLAKRQEKTIRSDIALPTPYVGPMDFAMDFDWVNATDEAIERVMPKTVYHSSKMLDPRNAKGCALSICEICFLNCIHRMLNSYIAQAHRCSLHSHTLDDTFDSKNFTTGQLQGPEFDGHGSTKTSAAAIEQQKKNLKLQKKRLRKHRKAKLAFLIRRCITSLRSLLEMVRFNLPASYRTHMENVCMALTKPNTQFQIWIVQIVRVAFKAGYSAKKKGNDGNTTISSFSQTINSSSASSSGHNGSGFDQTLALQNTSTTIIDPLMTGPPPPPEVTLKDVIFGLVGRECEESLADQIVYIAQHSLVESHQILNAIPLVYRKMLTYGTHDSLPQDDINKNIMLRIGDLIQHELVDETYCRRLMHETGLTEYDAVSKDKYLKQFVPNDYKDLCSDEFDRVVSHRYMQDRDENLGQDEGVLIPKPNSHVLTLGALRKDEFILSSKLSEGQRRKEKLLNLKKKVEADLQKEFELEAGLKETMELTSLHCDSLMEKIRIDDDYDKHDIMLNKHILARYNEETAARRAGSPGAKSQGSSSSPGGQMLPRLELNKMSSNRGRSPNSARGHSGRSGQSSHYNEREISLSARGRLRKERKGLSVEALLAATDLTATKRRRKKKQKNLFKVTVENAVGLGAGAKAQNVRQQVADQLGMRYLPPENLTPRLDNLKYLAINENVNHKSEDPGRQFENSMFYSRFALKMRGLDKINYQGRVRHDELKKVIQKAQLLSPVDAKKYVVEDLLPKQESHGTGNYSTRNRSPNSNAFSDNQNANQGSGTGQDSPGQNDDHDLNSGQRPSGATQNQATIASGGQESDANNVTIKDGGILNSFQGNQGASGASPLNTTASPTELNQGGHGDNRRLALGKFISQKFNFKEPDFNSYTPNPNSPLMHSRGSPQNPVPPFNESHARIKEEWQNCKREMQQRALQQGAIKFEKMMHHLDLQQMKK